MNIHLATDHAGFALKEELKTYLDELGHTVVDHGAFILDADDDYPDFVTLAARAVSANPGSMGIVIGGSGEAEMMCANKVLGIRAALFYGPVVPKEAVDVSGKQSEDSYEIVRLVREHNDANVLSLGARFISVDEAKKAVGMFLATPFSGDERHVRRIAKF